MRLNLREPNSLLPVTVKHRVPGRKIRGVVKPGVPKKVTICYQPTYELSRYPGVALRAIRARKTNFLGEAQR